MEPTIHFTPYTGWAFPNETVIEWTVLLAVYPYLTGPVAGAFTVSSLYQVFGFERLKPVAHLALLTSLCCMLFVALPLLLHLGHPERAFNAMITPHLTSTMAMFGFFATFYVILLMLEIWFAYRRCIVEQAQTRSDLLGRVYKLLTLGSYDASERLKGLAYTVWAFIMVALLLEGLEFANIVDKGREGVDMIMAYVSGPLLVPYFVLQFGFGAIFPMLLLSYMIWRGITGKPVIAGVSLSACLVMFSVFMMRRNVVMGGQEISKTGKGLLSYHLAVPRPGGRAGGDPPDARAERRVARNDPAVPALGRPRETRGACP